MSEMSIDDKIFLKQCLDEYGYLIYNTLNLTQVARRIPGASMKGNDLKEMSVICRSEMMSSSADLYKLINAYKNHFDPKMSIKDVMKTFDDEYSKMYPSDNGFPYRNGDPLSNAVSNINAALRVINSQIEFIRTSYKVSDSTDERFNKATVKSILKSDASLNNYCSSWDELEKIEAELNAAKIDPYSPEYGKLIIKRLNSFKADIISAFNKYFGKNSVFAEFNLSDMLR
jgi:hypothetical protein